jgi:DIS3-like exonuclease 1
MTYDQADNILQGKPPNAPNKPPPPPLTAGGPVDRSILGSLKDHLWTLTRLARKLRRDREEIGGAVDLSSGDLGTELKFTLQSGKPVKVVPKEDKEIHHTIAEMMILANSYVASKIYENFPDSSLLRIHRTVEEERFEDLREVLEARGVNFRGENNMALAKCLKDAEHRGSSGTVVNSLIRSLATRAMSEAQYVCTGDQDEGAELSHYGLGVDEYTHFTSPVSP